MSSNEYGSDQVFEGEVIQSPSTLVGFLEDAVERTVKTFTQNLAVFLVGGVAITAVPWGTAFQSAGIAAALTFLGALLTAQVSTTNAGVELVVRVARTFLATFLAAVPAVTPDHVWALSDVDWAAAASLAASAAVLSVVTSLGSWNLGAVKGSPSLVTLGR